MIFALFLVLTANFILRLNEIIPDIRGFPVVEVTLPILVALWLLFEKKDFSLSTDVLIPAFFAVIVLGYGLVVWPGGAFDIARGMIPWIMLYFLAANLVRSQKRMDWTFAVLVACSLALVSHSSQQFVNFDGENDATGVGWSGGTMLKGRVRYAGVMNDPNDLALFFAMMLPLALQPAARGMSLLKQCGGFLLCLPLLFGIFLTNSRGGLLACGTVATLFAWRRWGIVKAGVLCAVLAAGVLAYGPSRAREQSIGDERSVEGRVNAWYTGLQLFSQYPVLGCGKDEFVNYNVLTAHNSFVLCFAETGFLGYVAWFGAGCYALYGLHHALRRTRPGTASYRQNCALIDSLAAFYVGGFFLSRTYFILLPIFIGLAVARYRMARDDLEDMGVSDDSPARVPHSDMDDENPNDMLPGADPLPDLSRSSLLRTLPRVAMLAVLSIIGIWMVVKLKL